MCGKCCGVMVVLAVHHVAIMDGHALLGAGGGHAAVPPFCVICIRRGSKAVLPLTSLCVIGPYWFVGAVK